MMTIVPATKQLLNYLHQQQEAMRELLEQLVNAESPSTVPAAQHRILSILQNTLEQRNYRVQSISGRQTGGHLLAIPRDRQPHQPTQLLLGHCDTVWDLGTLEKMPFLVRQGKVYGPGCYDMKAGLVLLIFAIEAIQAAELRPTVAPVIFINSDEEIGSHESTKHIKRLAQNADRALVLEPSLGPTGKLKTARKGVGRFTIRVIGRAAHAGLEPEKGASAILELSFVIQKLFALNNPEAGITVNVGTIDGGIRSNVVAPESQAEVDVRVLHQDDAKQIEAAILGLQPTIPGTQLLIEGRIGRPPMERTPRNRVLWHMAQIAAADLGLDLDEGTAGGGSDGNTTSLYTPTLDGLGPVGEDAHAPGEMIYLEQMVERSALLARLLLEPPLQAALR